ncbi:hypothetical protein [Parasitella parasitica]|uniref:Uncharacterized protein n=1 Tax=Parasitella parasitica TaxID=35722 RepID=A0A0B7NDE7_9FUNG|nr:hypothetical protein [Parasitella parasitica]
MPMAKLGPHLGSFSLPTLLELPFLTLCVLPKSSSSTFNTATLKSAKAYDFVQPGSSGSDLHFKLHKESRHPTFALDCEDISWPSDELPVLGFPNPALRQMHLQSNPALPTPSLHLVPFLRVPETASHLLFTYPALFVFGIWRNFIVLFFAFCPPLDMQAVYRSAIALQVPSNYRLLDSYLQVSPPEVLTCILFSIIWSAHWHFHFDFIPIIDQSVLDSAIKEVRYISVLNQFRPP